jgi:SPX domain protein involved in polyphosphate accumulation
MNEREKVINKLTTEIAKASNAKKFTESEEGQYVINLLKELVSGYTNKMLNSRVDHLDYVELRAEIAVLRKVIQVLETQSSDSVINQLTERLDLAASES